MSNPTHERRHARGRSEIVGIPVVPTIPVLGVLPYLLGREGVAQGLIRLGERFGRGGIFAMPLPGGSQKVFVCSAALAEEVVDDDRWEKAVDPLLEQIRLLVGNGLFTADNHDPAWGVAHRVLTPAFSGAAMANYVPAMTVVLDDLVNHWRRASGPLDVTRDMTRLTLDTIALTGFNQRFRSVGGRETDPFVRSFTSALGEVVERSFRPHFLAPYEAYRARRFEHDRATVFGLVDRVVATRRDFRGGATPRDLLSRMMTEVDPKTGAKLDDENIRYQVLTFLLAGHETTSNLLSFALHFVARDANLAARLRREADEVLDHAQPTLEQIKSLELAGRVLDETLRLYPTAQMFMRRPKQTSTIGGRYTFTPDDDVGVMLPMVHRDPAVWEDPERFDPDRFLPDRVRSRPAGAYKPFGTGKRICTGRNFARVEAALALATLAREFDFADPGPLRIMSAPLPKPRGFRLGVRPRVRRHASGA